MTAREAWLPPNGEVRGAVALPPGTTNAVLSMYDMNGRLVASRALDTTGEAAGAFAWDGSLTGGSHAPSAYYELRATGDVGGVSTALDVMVAGRIESVSLESAGGAVELTVTGLGRVALSDVRRVSSATPTS